MKYLSYTSYPPAPPTKLVYRELSLLTFVVLFLIQDLLEFKENLT